MKRNKRTRKIKRNSLKSEQQQVSLSQIKSTTTDCYLPDECWESVFEFLITKGDNYNNRYYLNSLSTVSKQFLSITNSLLFSLTIKRTHPFIPRLFHRFTNLRSLGLFHQPTIPAGLRAFSQKITTLTSLTCLYIESLKSSDLFIIANCFPNLQLLELSDCRDISEEGIAHVLRRCCNIRDLNLAGCSSVTLCAMNFEVPKLEVLDLSFTRVDDKTLYVISKSCPGLLQLRLVCCKNVTEKGVKHVVENCTQLREINLRGFLYNVVASMISSRPSLRKIIVFP